MNDTQRMTDEEAKRRFDEELAAGIITPLVWVDELETETTEQEEQ